MRYIFVAGYIHDQLTISILFTAVSCDNWQKPLKVTKKTLTWIQAFQGHSRSSNLSPVERA